MRINADINQSVLDAKSRQEAMEFESFLKGESAKRTMAWEVEKAELSRQHDFEKQIQRKDLEIDLRMQKESMQQSKLDAKVQALNDAAEDGQISSEEAKNEITRLQLGAPSDLFQKTTAEDRMIQQLMGDRGETNVSPEQKNSASLLSFSKKAKLNKEDQKDVDKILEEGDANKIKQTLDILEARAGIEEGPGLLKSMSPVGMASELIRLNRLKKQAGVPEEKKRKRSPSFSPYTQSMGSFR